MYDFQRYAKNSCRKTLHLDSRNELLYDNSRNQNRIYRNSERKWYKATRNENQLDFSDRIFRYTKP